MKLFFKLFLLLAISFQFSYATSKYFTNKYNTAKRNYLSSIMSGDKTKELYYLKRLILFGNKIDINTKRYEKELNRLDKSTIKKKHTTVSKLPKIEKKVRKIAKPQKHIYSLKELFGNLDNYGLNNKKKKIKCYLYNLQYF